MNSLKILKGAVISLALMVILAGMLSTASAATVVTDKLDYSPGDIVTMTGSGWEPGETVSMVLHEEPQLDLDLTLSSIAGADGSFINTDFSPDWNDIWRTFTLTAIGDTSGLTVQIIFADTPRSCPTGFEPDPTCPLTNYELCKVGCKQEGSTPQQCHPIATAPATAMTVCRAAAGACDVEEVCDGSSQGVDACPDDSFMPSGTECRASAGVCDPAETCTGTDPACPTDAKSTVVCRAADGPCDVPESCDGIGNDCPPDGFVASGTVCRASAGVCDPAETCTGNGPSCPDDAKSTEVCRAAVGPCDVPESCDGVSNDCPPDGFVASGTVCRASAGVCDPAETCTGNGPSCPDDAKSTEVCRAAVGPCDVPESCDGVSNACPADQFASATTHCTGVSQNGACDDDTADHCLGTSNSCVDAFKTSSTVCRASAGQCDVAENCTGTSSDCPADQFASATTHCTGVSQNGACDDDTADHCLGTSNSCVDAFKASSEVCRPAASVCDAAEHCTGSSAACPDDMPAECGLVTSSSLCTFDIDAISGNQFRLIFIPDQGASISKLTASNPGQFYYNVVYLGSGNETLTMTLPYPFVTQGAVPIHIYSDVTTWMQNGSTCFAPGAEIANESRQVLLGDYGVVPSCTNTTCVVNVDLPSLPYGVAYVNIHLDYGFKGMTNYAKSIDIHNNVNAINTAPELNIPDKQTYLFTSSIPYDDTVQSENVFKKDPGIGGLVLDSGSNPVPSVTVKIYDAKNNLLGTVTTDQDGWYMWSYKYTGKSATFTVKLPLPYNQAKSVTLKSNGFLVTNFNLP